jgi:hypothetical protein
MNDSTIRNNVSEMISIENSLFEEHPKLESDLQFPDIIRRFSKHEGKPSRLFRTG